MASVSLYRSIPSMFRLPIGTLVRERCNFLACPTFTPVDSSTLRLHPDRSESFFRIDRANLRQPLRQLSNGKLKMIRIAVERKNDFLETY